MANFAYSVFIPILVFVIGAQVMKTYANHNDVAAATKNLDHGKFKRGALNQRLAGYTLADAKKVWDVIESVDKGRDAETLYLKTDLLFPLVYGSGFAFGLFVAVRTFGWEIHPLVLFSPIIVAMIADWVENSIQLREFAKYGESKDSLSESALQIASLATSAKLGLLLLVGFAIVGLSAWNLGKEIYLKFWQ